MGIIPGFYMLTIVIILLSFSVTGEASPKFLILHLDAVSSQNFFQYMEEGYLPNLKAVFEDGHMIHHGLSLFPGGTETAVPHLKEGIDNSKVGVVWGYRILLVYHRCSGPSNGAEIIRSQHSPVRPLFW